MIIMVWIMLMIIKWWWWKLWLCKWWDSSVGIDGCQHQYWGDCQPPLHNPFIPMMMIMMVTTMMMTTLVMTTTMMMMMMTMTMLKEVVMTGRGWVWRTHLDLKISLLYKYNHTITQIQIHRCIRKCQFEKQIQTHGNAKYKCKYTSGACEGRCEGLTVNLFTHKLAHHHFQHYPCTF